MMHNSKMNNPTNLSSFSRSLKQILKALGGATVSLGATFSLLTSSAQAASFVTTFETSAGDVTLFWSGEDFNDDDLIKGNELSGPIHLTDWNGSVWSWSDVSSLDAVNFEYNTVSSLISLDEGYHLDLSEESEVSWQGIWSMEFGELVYLEIWTDYGYDEEHHERLVEYFTQSTVNAAGGGGGGNPQPNLVASTPEPTLTLGLITLGGLMLGSKKKRKA